MADPISQQGLYQDGNSIFENVHILGTLEVSGIVNTETGLNVSGIITATEGGTVTYYGDGSNLTGVVASDVPVGSSSEATIFYETDDATTISTTTTLSRASSNPGKIYTKFQEVVVGTAPGTVELIVADGEEFIVDAYQLAVNTKDVQ